MQRTWSRRWEDFIPPSYPTEIELQTLAAVLECTSKSLFA